MGWRDMWVIEPNERFSIFIHTIQMGWSDMGLLNRRN